MPYEDDVRTQLITLLLRADTELFRDLALRTDLKPIQPCAILALWPYLSMYLCESSQYFEQRELLSVDDLTPHDPLLQRARLRTKILDSNHWKDSKTIRHNHKLAQINSEWYFASHQGRLAWLKRRLQCDLGIATIRGDLLSTTHVLFLNLGLTNELLMAERLSLSNLGKFLGGVAVDLGRYIGKSTSVLGIETELEPHLTGLELPTIIWTDVKSLSYYRQMAAKVAPGAADLCLPLTQVLSSVNLVRDLVPVIAGDNQISLFRIRFLSLYHATNSLNLMLSDQRIVSALTPLAQDGIKSAIVAGQAGVTARGRSLRKALAHYAVKDHSLKLDRTLPLLGLVEACLGGMSMQEVDIGVQTALDYIAARLADLLCPT